MTRRLLLLAPAAALLVAVSSVDLPLFTLGPGPAREVLPLIDVDGARTYRPDNRMLLTTVGVDRPNAFEALWAWVVPELDVVTEEQVIPPELTEREYERHSRADMAASKIAAAVVALRKMTDYPETRSPGGLVQEVVPGSPADGPLFPGDVILEVDGRRLADLDALREAIARSGAGRELELTVERGGKRRQVRVRPRMLPGSDGPVIGIVVVENLPFDVTIRSGDVGGPSAGLMWALALVDLLGPGELADVRTIAGTGEIDIAGRVYPVGGVAHKVVAASRAGAEIFLLPAENLSEARAAGTDIRLVAVGTVDEAIRALEAAA